MRWLPLTAGFFQVVGNDELRAFCTATLVKGMECENGMSILVSRRKCSDGDFNLGRFAALRGLEDGTIPS